MSASDDETGRVTLAFSLAAVERLEDPTAAFEDAQTWSRAVGLIDDDTDRIERLVEQHDLRQDFDLQGRDRWLTLEEVRETTSTPRHVYVGASDDDMRVSTMFDWEYVRVTEAAEKADWAVAEPSESGVLARLLSAVRSLFR
ncbi:Uncharacterized protein HSBGL_0997 [Halapricum desulfuricans]|uniref:DUF7124 domain-containing protein n=1 Tax=Halapricum desulfuricans TaxID=2841257 RepID=A0A897NG64_9EURY|nr:hypothetical protein [Halapricum desulfuricans]QSG11424.1 Uncharacterized protein HSBGL_0997 [Halapricum desulfuricans]